MNKEELAKQLDGMEEREHRRILIKDDKFIKEIEDSGLIIITGYSDDCIEFDGAIRDEVGEGIVYFGRNGVVEEFESAKHTWNSEEDCFDWFRRKKNSIEIRGDFGEFWKFSKPSVDFASFKLYEDGELFSEGLVIDKNDLPETLD